MPSLRKTRVTNQMSVFMLALDLTESEVARRMGVKQQQISYWKNGYVIPNAVRACKLARILETTVEEIWGNSVLTPRNKSDANFSTVP